MKLNELIYNKVAKQYGLSPKVIEEIHRLNWKFIKDKIEELPLKEDITEEELNKLRLSFHIKGLGTLYTTKELITYLKERHG